MGIIIQETLLTGQAITIENIKCFIEDSDLVFDCLTLDMRTLKSFKTSVTCLRVDKK